ncbi:MAG: sigma factor-like helix-turn-helix DNA-binding protein [Eubacteriales bacterium]|nr:sigma factor-like helix-turn-helix DNA-binding protein [Eubacteriales bacterium]
MYLESVGCLEERLNILLRQQSVLFALARAEGENKSLRQAQSQTVGDAIQTAWKKLDRQRRLVAHSVSRLPREEERDLLSLRYLSRLSWPDIAEVLGYSQRQVFRIHQRALMHMEALAAGMEAG